MRYFKTRLFRVSATGLGLILSVGLLSGCGTQVSTQMLQIGDCFNTDNWVLSGRQSGVLISTIPCTFSHNSEVVGKHKLSEINYRNPDNLVAIAEKLCIADFQQYHGKDYQQTNYDLYPFFPNSKNLNRDDTNNSIICIALHLPATSSSAKKQK